jgi:hypothetical protein
MTTLMNAISTPSRELLQNAIVQSMSTIDFGKAMARNNELMQRDILRYCGIEAYDPETDAECPAICTQNNSPGFDILVKTAEKNVRIQSKLRQVKGKTDFSQQVHFETTRRHSAKNIGTNSADSGHIAYSTDEFDYVMISLINVANDKILRHDVDRWSFSLVPVSALIHPEKGCCVTHIPAKTLEKYKFVPSPENPPTF